MLFSDLVGPCARQDQGSSSWPYTLLDVDPTTCQVPRHSSDAVCYSVRTVAVRKILCLNSPTTIRWMEWFHYYYYSPYGWGFLVNPYLPLIVGAPNYSDSVPKLTPEIILDPRGLKNKINHQMNYQNITHSDTHMTQRHTPPPNPALFNGK